MLANALQRGRRLSPTGLLTHSLTHMYCSTHSLDHSLPFSPSCAGAGLSVIATKAECERAVALLGGDSNVAVKVRIRVQFRVPIRASLTLEPFPCPGGDSKARAHGYLMHRMTLRI